MPLGASPEGDGFRLRAGRGRRFERAIMGQGTAPPVLPVLQTQSLDPHQFYFGKSVKNQK
jgi:hypothetical protein